MKALLIAAFLSCTACCGGVSPVLATAHDETMHTIGGEYLMLLRGDFTPTEDDVARGERTLRTWWKLNKRMLESADIQGRPPGMQSKELVELVNSPLPEVTQ